MKLHLGLASKVKRLFISSPVKEGALNGENPVGELGVKSLQEESGFGFRIPSYGSKEDAFFDSRAWLDSDCEDDFYSVNGDFTPSRGSTPNHQFGAQKTPQQNKAVSGGYPDTKSEPSPTEKKRKLADLLQETSFSEEVGNEPNAISGKVGLEVNGKTDAWKLDADHHLKSSEGTPYLSGPASICGSEKTPVRDSKLRREKKHTHCCLPGLVPIFSINERKRDKMSPQSYHG